VPVATILAEPVSSYVSHRSFTGKMVAARSSRLGFERSGKVVQVLVDQGDRVSAGQPLARLDTRHVLTDQRRLQAQRGEAAAVLEELRAGPRKEQIDAARAEVANRQAQVALQKLNTSRRELLIQTRSVSQEEFDSAKFGLESAQARLEAARHRLDEMLAGTRSEQIQAAEAAVDQLDAALADLDHQLDDCTLMAPFSGTISERLVDEGAIVSPGTPIVRLIENARLEAWIGVPIDVSEQLRAGQNVQIIARGQPYGGRLVAVLPEVDEATRTRRAVIGLEGRSVVGLVPGQVVRLQLQEVTTVDGFWLPTSALTRGARGVWACYAVAPDPGFDNAGRVERRDVEILHTTGERVFVRGTLTGGERVVAAGTHRVTAGQLVRSIDAGRPPSERETAVSTVLPSQPTPGPGV
jgi:multidrug efflux pump subunit AcrA (membrane-fusion protein)